MLTYKELVQCTRKAFDTQGNNPIYKGIIQYLMGRAPRGHEEAAAFEEGGGEERLSRPHGFIFRV